MRCFFPFVSQMRLARFLLALVLAIAPIFARGDELRIITSMPPSLTDPFVAAFEAHHPGIEVLLLNKNTNAALSEILRGNPRGFQIFWASSPEAFTLIAARDGFAPAGCAAAGAGGHVPFAYSSIGWTMRRDRETQMPKQWDHLLGQVYRGRVGLALPSRSGTTHMLVERFLQVRGWDEGWAYFLGLSGNLATLSARSFGVIEGVRAGRFDFGLTIDFLAKSEPDLAFRYGMPAMIFPAQIGLLHGSAPDGPGCAFIEFVTSAQGQRLLLKPEINRTPALAEVRHAANPVTPDPLEPALVRQWQGYNADLAQRRYWVVNTIFELFIADQLPRRRLLFARLDALEGRASRGAIAQLRTRLVTLPVSEVGTMSPDLNAVPGHASDLVQMTAPQKAAYLNWQQVARDQLDAIESGIARLEHPGR